MTSPSLVRRFRVASVPGRAVLAGLLLGLATLGCGDGSVPGDPIEARIDRLFPADPPFGVVNREQVRRMLEVPAEEDGPFLMLNLIRHRERALYPDGRDSDLSGAEADAIYGAGVIGILAEIGARPVFVAEVEINLIDPDGSKWEQIAMVEYPSRRAFFEMLERPDFRELSIHKAAGVEETLVIVGGERTQFPEGLLEVDLDALPNPPTAADPPIAICHILDYHEVAQYADGRETTLTGREAMALYEQGRQEQDVLGLGVRPGLWLPLEGEFLGRGSTFEEFRINLFPNRKTFFQVAAPDSSAEAGIEHRVAALRETYTQLTAPRLNEFGYR